MDITIYESSGEIIFSMEVADDVDVEGVDFTAMIPAGGGWIEGKFSPDYYYVDVDVATLRPVIDTPDGTSFRIEADDTDEAVIACPDNTVVDDIDGNTTYLISSADDLVVRSQIEGTFDFNLTPPFPYRPLQITVIAYVADN